jgi:hypothetical protein
MDQPASVWAEVTTPSALTLEIPMGKRETGTYSGTFTAGEAGVYRARVRAADTSARGLPFRREQTVSCSVWIGGNNQVGGGSNDDKLCRLLNCLVGKKGAVTPELEALLRRFGFDISGLRRCLGECAKSRVPENERASTAG